MTPGPNVLVPLDASDGEDLQIAQKIIHDAEEALRNIPAESLTLPALPEAALELGDRFEWERLGGL